MRLDSIFFVAVLFACFNLSSILVVSITFKAPAHEFDVETAKEERTSSIPVFDTVIKKIKSMTSSGMEENVDVNNVVDVYKTLQRHKGILSHNERYNDGIRYLERTSLDTLKAELESSGNDRDKIFLKVLITFMKENADESIQNKLKTTLLTFWDDKDRSVHDVFKLLKLDHKTNDKVYSNLLKMWVEYPRSSDVEMKLVMADYNDKTRLKILKGLSEIEGTEEVVKQLQDNLVALWKIEKPSAKNLFAKLELDKAGSEVYFDMWIKYVVQECDKLHVSKSVIRKLSTRHGDEGLLKMFNALAQAEVGKKIQGKLTSALITSWKNQEKSTRDVYELLELNVKSETNEPINVKLFSMWVQYAVHMQDTDIGAVINRCNLDFRVAILGDLKQIKGMNGVVQLLQNSLLGHFLNFEGSYQDQVVQVFRDLNLQNDLLRNPNLDLFYSFTEKLDRGKTKEEWLITAARAACGDMVLNKILEAAKKNDRTAKLLRRELDRQKSLEKDNAFNAYLEGQLQSTQELKLTQEVALRQKSAADQLALQHV